MYVDKNVYTASNGKTYARYLLRESKRQGKETIKKTMPMRKVATHTPQKTEKNCFIENSGGKKVVEW